MKVEDIQTLMHCFEQSGLAKMEVKEKEFSLKLEKPHREVSLPVMDIDNSTPPVLNKMDTIQSEEAKEDEGIWIKAPLVGTFYASRSQDSQPFVEIGQSVKKGDVLCIIEAMKVMNELRAPSDGIVRSILVTNASMVEYNQNLIRLGEDV